MRLLKKFIFGVYYVLKAAVFKFVEYMLRSFLAIIGIGSCFWGIFCVVLLFIEVFVPLPEYKLVMLFFLMGYGILFMYKFGNNFRDDDDRDFVRMMLARLEHKLCFDNPDLSIYPQDWHWLEEA